MLTAHLEDRFRQALGVQRTAGRDDAVRFAVDFVRLLAQVAPEGVSPEARDAMKRALAARSDLAPGETDLLLGLALAPENRSIIEEHELRAFGSRFGKAEEEALRAAIVEDMHLTGFAERYGPAEALLLLDALFAVCAVDGMIDNAEIGRLQQAAAELGVDQMLVGALFRKHDARHAAGQFRFELTEDRYLIGRSLSASIQLPDPQVAQRHVELVRTHGESTGEAPGWRFIDLGSGRPTLLNGAPVGSAPLRPGDVLRVGPYSLTLDPASRTLTAFGLDAFSALSVRKLQRRIQQVTLLEGVSFTVFSGEVIALVGPSGSGKTTLLSAIAGIAPADAGDVLLDGQDFHGLLAHDRSIVGIVPQDDVVHAELTVDEALFYAGRLRFPADVPSAVIRDRVGKVVEELGLDHIRRSRIGDTVRRGVSGGQKKRVSLGQELLTHTTKVLFLDEPTSGLDPQTAQDIVALVRQLADDGRIVFLVTHDVSPSIMNMVDHLLVLAPGGRLAWFGPPDDACGYFGVESADEIFGRLPDSSPEAWAARYKGSEAFRKYVRTREHLLGLDAVEITRAEKRANVARSPLSQYLTLTRRYAKVKARDTVGTAVLIAQAPILALAMWAVFPAPDTAAMFMLVLSSLWFGASASVRELISERTIWRRERRVGLGLLPYMASKVTVLGGLVALQCGMLAAMDWGLVGFSVCDLLADPCGLSWCDATVGSNGACDYTVGATMRTMGVSLPLLGGVAVLTGWVGVSLGLLMSSLFASSEAAVGTLPLVLIPQIAFGGLIVKVKEMSFLAKLLSYGMITRYAFDAAIKTGDKLSVPKFSGSGRQTYPISGVLHDLGFRATTQADDLGLPLLALLGVLGAFLAVFLTAATVLTGRSAKGS